MSDGASNTIGAGAKLGKYEVRAVIGRGAMGTVLEAWDPVIDRRVAVKTVKLPGAGEADMQEELQRFRREAQAAGRLNHPNIVGVFDYGETDELAFIVMEFVDGQSVKARLDSGERFSPAAAARLMEDVLGGLQYSHDSGVIHRDIKPANLMLTRAGQAKIADFGIARIESSSMTQAGTLLGTPAYMSPEQFRGETVDARTDIYSSAVLLYQLLTGDRPFEGSLSSIMHKALTTEPPAPSVLSTTAPRPLDAVVARAMAKRPDDRFPSAAAFMDAIRAAMAAPAPASDATVFAPPRAAASPAAAPRRRLVPLLLAGGVAVVAAGVTAAVLLTHAPPPPAVQVASSLPPTAIVAPPAATPDVSPPSPFTAIPPDPAPQAAEPPARLASITPPAPDPAVIRQRVGAVLAGLPCTALSGQVAADGAAELRGFTGPGSLPALQDALTRAGAPLRSPDEVAQADDSYCPALSAIAPVMPALGSATPHLTLAEASGNGLLLEDQYIRPRVRMAAFAGSLLVDYYAHDGTVEHVYPRLADPAQKMPADPSRPFVAGEMVTFGEPGSRRATFQVGPPYGRDMMVAIASSQPLFPGGRPANGEQSATYAKDLKAALNAARARGAQLSAAVTRLDTAER